MPLFTPFDGARWTLTQAGSYALPNGGGGALKNVDPFCCFRSLFAHVALAAGGFLSCCMPVQCPDGCSDGCEGRVQKCKSAAVAATAAAAPTETAQIQLPWSFFFGCLGGGGR